MKRYYKVKDGEGGFTGEIFVHVFEETDEEHCDICSGAKNYLTNIDGFKRDSRFDGLCRHNLKKHLASGKHWKSVDGYYIKPK